MGARVKPGHDRVGIGGGKAPGATMHTKLFIDGRWAEGLAGGTIEVLNPFDNSRLALVAEAREEDVDRAVEAARRAFPAWSRLAAHDRGRLLLRLADAIETNREALAELESRDT